MADIRKLLGNNKNLAHVVKYTQATGQLAWLKVQKEPIGPVPKGSLRTATGGNNTREQTANNDIGRRQGSGRQATLWSYGFGRGKDRAGSKEGDKRDEHGSSGGRA